MIASRSCPECGLPTVWSDTHMRTWCAVYGRHRPIPEAISVGGRNYNALLANVVDELASARLPADTARARKYLKLVVG